jgi:protein TonB
MLIRKKIQKNILNYLIVLSILLHFVFVYKFPIFIKSETPKTNDDLIIIEPMQNKKPKKIKKHIKDLKGEIVDLTTEEDNKEPEDTKYLSDRNRSVDKETEARIKTHIPTPLNLETFYNDAFNNPEIDIGKKLNEKIYSEGDYFSYNKGLSDNKSVSGAENRRQASYDMFLKSQINFNTPYDPNYLEGLEQGDLTRLNTKEFLYSGFFTRVKRQIASLWRPDETFARIQRFNSIIYAKLITTTVSITLNSDGYLVEPNVFVITSSGFADWDNESVRCVREAAPFLNPPKGLVDSSGNITFTFAFIGEMRPEYNNIKR